MHIDYYILPLENDSEEEDIEEAEVKEDKESIPVSTNNASPQNVNFPPQWQNPPFFVILNRVTVRVCLNMSWSDWRISDRTRPSSIS